MCVLIKPFLFVGMSTYKSSLPCCLQPIADITALSLETAALPQHSIEQTELS
jgi:hypothetical protein